MARRSSGAGRRRSSETGLFGQGMEKLNRSGRQVLRIMEEMPAFKYMHERERAELGEMADIVRCPGGTIVYEAGEPGEYVYFVVQGALELRTRVGPGMAQPVRALDEGGIAGLDVALGSEAYALQCYARDKTACLRFSTSDLADVLRAARPSAVKLFTSMGLELGRQIRAATNEVVFMLERTSIMPAKAESEYSEDDMSRILSGG